MSVSDQPGDRLPRQYQQRFEAHDAARRRVWGVLVGSFFHRYLEGVSTVLDLGCGWGYFINQVDVRERHAIDLNPDVAAHLEPGISLHRQAATERWPVEDGAIDLVFTSNFLEHLPGAGAVTAALDEAHRCLRPGGRLIAMGPNIRAVGGAYWDFFDHVVPLTDRSIGEALELCGFEIERSIPRFLPFTMADKTPPPSWAIRAYLRCKPAWRLMGGQFLVVARRPAA